MYPGFTNTVWFMESGARDHRSCEESTPRGDKVVFLTICGVEFPFMVILVKSRTSYIGCWVGVWPYSDHKPLSSLKYRLDYIPQIK